MAELARSGQRFALATVVRTHGSTPQVVGAKLVVTDHDERGRAAGTLGGGCVEADAILAAREVLANGGRSLRAYELTEDLAWNTGLVCGGTMWILAERDRRGAVERRRHDDGDARVGRQRRAAGGRGDAARKAGPQVRLMPVASSWMPTACDTARSDHWRSTIKQSRMGCARSRTGPPGWWRSTSSTIC